jgi:dGTPase
MRRIETEDGLSRAVTDYIAGMTDQYAVEKFMEIYIPKAWNR